VSEDVGPASQLMRIIARLRVALGFACGVLVFWLARPTSGTIPAGLAVAAAGELIRFWAAGHLQKSREVTTSGPYRFVAHPLYLGSSVIGAGLAIASGSLVVAVIVAGYLAVTLTAAIRSEEAFLRRAFGEEYEHYRRTGVIQANRPFSLARAMANREYRAVVGLAVAVLLLAWKASYNGVL
jgi:protein-S-isoprenylcysteine O-methyltransferase Ste14